MNSQLFCCRVTRALPRRAEDLLASKKSPELATSEMSNPASHGTAPVGEGRGKSRGSGLSQRFYGPRRSAIGQST